MKTQQNYMKFEEGLTSSHKLTDFWYKHCMERGIPYVLLKTEGKRASIECNYNTLPSALNEVLQENHTQIKRQVIQMFEQYAHGSRATHEITWSTISLFNVPMRSAEFIAESIYKLINSYNLK